MLSGRREHLRSLIPENNSLCISITKPLKYSKPNLTSGSARISLAKARTCRNSPVSSSPVGKQVEKYCQGGLPSPPHQGPMTQHSMPGILRFSSILCAREGPLRSLQSMELIKRAHSSYEELAGHMRHSLRWQHQELCHIWLIHVSPPRLQKGSEHL